VKLKKKPMKKLKDEIRKKNKKKLKKNKDRDASLFIFYSHE
jgi:hypothetical protein